MVECIDERVYSVMITIPLGSSGPPVSALALGCMGMSGMYGPSDEQESISTIHAAIDAGINLLDTGDFYGMGHNEMLIGRAIEGRRERVLLSVKFGGMRMPNGAFIGLDGRPNAVKNFLSYSLQRLRTDHIDIYRLTRPDPAVPIEETVGAIGELIQAGYVRYVGLSESGAAAIRRAHATHPVCDLQIEYSLASRSIEREILPTVRSLGIAVTAYGVLSRGLLTGSQPAGKNDFRAQLAIAWVMSQGDDIVPVIGARTRRQLAESLAALEVKLSAAEIARLEEICNPQRIQGTRYGADQMQMLDSER